MKRDRLIENDGAALDAGMREIMRDVDAAAAAGGTACGGCGTCCDFTHQEFVLFASSVEVLWVLAHVAPLAVSPDHCPFQHKGRCDIRPWRPVGCRMYYCRLGTTSREYELYEGIRLRMAKLAEKLDVPWEYGPFLTMLAEYSGRPPLAETA
jgi:hypothetical protein